MEPHTGFVVAAFAVTGIVVFGTIAAVLLDYRAQLRALARLGGTATSDAADRGSRS